MNKKNQKLLTKINNEKRRSSLEKIKRKKRRELIFIVTLFLIVIAVFTLLFSNYLKLKTIDVEGNNQITKEEILEAGNINNNLRTWSIKDEEIQKKLHQTVKKVTESIEDDFHFNTAIAAVMELLNDMTTYKQEVIDKDNISSESKKIWREVLEKTILLIAPFAPHVADELWAYLGNKTFTFEEEWPKYDEELTKEFGKAVKAIRVICNSPSTFGGIGDVYNAFLPSLTLGCGSYGRNSVGDNVSAINLLNIKKVGRRRNNMQWMKLPSKTYFERDSIEYLQKCRDVERVMIVTDHAMVELGFLDRIIEQLDLRRNKVVYQIFADVEPDPDITTVERGTEIMRAFKPDTIIALGGGSPMDAAKVMWLFYEQPEVDFRDLVQKFMDIRKRAFKFPLLGKKTKFIAIPTTSGTGSEVTPFAVISDKANNRKYPIADYSLTPTVAIVDPALVLTVPGSVAADTGMDVLTHATEAYVSQMASDFTDGLALQAIKLVFENLESSVKNADFHSREKMHNASTIAGMAFANAFLGISHSMAHKIGAQFHTIHGRTNAILLPYVIRYNGTRPAKTATWPKYNYYRADEKYQDIARMLGLPCSTPEEAVEAYAKAVYELGERCGIEMNFKAQGIDEKEWKKHSRELAFLAYEDQCSPANPRLPMVDHMQEIIEDAYYGYKERPGRRK